MISLAISLAAGNNSSGLWIDLINPPSKASSGPNTLPEYIHSKAFETPTILGRNQDEHASGTKPLRAKTNPYFASSDANLISIANCIVMPTPTAGPLQAEIIGFKHSNIFSVTLPPPSLTPEWDQSISPLSEIAPFLSDLLSILKVSFPADKSAPAQ